MASSSTRLHVPIAHRHLRKCPSEKIGYPHKGAALDAAEVMMRQDRVNPGCHITPYSCDECGEWHVRNRRIVAV